MYEMQIQIKENDKLVWKSVKPSGSNIPYRYKDKETAINMLNMCYPTCDCNVKKRIIFNPIK